MLKPTCSCDKHPAAGDSPAGTAPGPRSAEGPVGDLPAVSPTDDALAPGGAGTLAPSR
ncbi:hypothetical protein [Streptomyces sp. NPDC026673]|uniref:hypothetical protein n=1 Tax=Streptomyces sp. NPDC026673 TaxID=3155724 RepID=UPI00340680EC